MSKLTPLQAEVLALNQRGFRPADIATQLNRSRSAINNLLTKLRRKGEAVNRARVPPNSFPLYLRLDADTFERLQAVAEERGQGIRSLSRDLLTIIAQDDMVDAIIDEGEEE